MWTYLVLVVLAVGARVRIGVTGVGHALVDPYVLRRVERAVARGPVEVQNGPIVGRAVAARRIGKALVIAVVVWRHTAVDGIAILVEGEIGAESLFATIFGALGIDHQKNYYVGARPVPLTNPGTKPIPELLA